MLNNDALILRLLSGVKVFDGFSPQDGKDLLAHAIRCDVKAGERVIAEGDKEREFYIVLAGDFSVVKAMPSGKEKVIAMLHPGDTFGEMSFLDGRPRAATVVAEAPGLLLKFERSGLMRIPETAAKIYFNMASLMVGRVRETNTLVSLALEGRTREAGVPRKPCKPIATSGGRSRCAPSRACAIFTTLRAITGPHHAQATRRCLSDPTLSAARLPRHRLVRSPGLP
jgi:CRP-like cAMP-binding protein